MNRIVLQRVVCAIDVAERSTVALSHAVRMARLHNADLRVLHVASAEPGASEANGREDLLALRRALDEYDAEHLHIRAVVALGNPRQEVPRYARRVNADLVVIGRTCSARRSERSIGAVADAVLREASCPVLVVPTVDDAIAAPDRYREIVCGVSSGLSSSTLRYALSLAQEFESRLTLVNVDSPAEWGPLHPGAAMLEDDLERLRSRIPESAHEWCEIDEIVSQGEPARELWRAAERLRADLVIVGSTSTRDYQCALGRVAAGTLARLTCPALVVPAPLHIDDTETPSPAFETTARHGVVEPLISH